MDEPPVPPNQAAARSDRLGWLGYGCLLSTLSAGLLGGGALVFLAVSRIVRGSATELQSGADAQALSLSLEGAVIAAGAGTLLILIAVVSGVVLLKELADDAGRRRRGPVR